LAGEGSNFVAESLVPPIVATLLKWVIAFAVIGGLCGAAWLVHGWSAQDHKSENDKVASPNLLEDKPYIKLNKVAAESHGIETEPAKAVTWREHVVVFGRVVPNPRATYEVRSPFAGTLAADQASPWPMPGQSVQPGQLLGRVTLRVGPQERLDLQTKLADARLKFEGAEKVAQLRQEVVDRLSKISSTSLPQREWNEAKAQLVEAQTQLATAKAALDIWQQAQDELDRVTEKNGVWSRPLPAPYEPELHAPLEVSDLGGQPGASVEAGGLVFRLVDYSRVLVRLDLPADMVRHGPPAAELKLSVIAPPPRALRGAFNRTEAAVPEAPMTATLVGPAGPADTSSQFVGYYYLATLTEASGKAAKTGQRAWRPGLFVQAAVLVPGAGEQDAVSVPLSALLYHQGRALVYVRHDEVHYERREVQVLGQEDGQVFLAQPTLLHPEVGVSADELVANGQPQVLLWAEFFRKENDNDDK
jgi:multidrug efflux pump subunit AcrA (membrane-fusion protein)